VATIIAEVYVRLGPENRYNKLRERSGAECSGV